MNEIIWFLASMFLTIFILDKFGFLKRLGKDWKKSNEIIAKEKEKIRLIDEELERRKKSK